ncbi:MFS transporter [Haloimpatiens sp. FM7315]|uniref:MFS transporter n=1 Tax=Haloimpatiens sp. FM7315 TaxID=3298609 RepID=UPI0035A29696
MNNKVKVYRYRFVVLLVFAFINFVIQMQWLTFAPIAEAAQKFYNVSSLKIDFLSLIFMIVFILACVPASYVIDTYGIRIGVGIGAVFTLVFALMKGLGGDSYEVVCVAQCGLAFAQPFIINAVTKVGVKWFPINERATEAGIVSLCQYLGIIFAMMVTPQIVKESLVDNIRTYNIKHMLIVYAVISIVSAVLVLIFLKEEPINPPEEEESKERLNLSSGMKHMFKKRDMILLLVLFFIGLGMFNAISTCIDQICKAKSLNSIQTGIIGGIMLIGGVIGACILPVFSDKFRKRKLFLSIALLFMVPGLIGLTFFKSYLGMLVSSFIFGFFFMSAGPIGFQYGAEICYPAPESSSQGLILLAGQISGIIFVVVMNSIGVKTSMIIFIILSLINIVITRLIKESPRMLKNK